MDINFNTDEEWITHSINIHGYFFERWCQEVINTAKGWQVKYTNYPVEYPPANGAIRGKESKLDICAELKIQDKVLKLLIECKKNNPEFVNWIFFSKPKEQLRPNFPRFAYIENKHYTSSYNSWEVKRFFRVIPLDPFFDNGMKIITDEARESKGSYKNYRNNDKTKTSNAAITEAAQQVALATQALIVEETAFSEALATYKSLLPLPYELQMFMPVIVTTAKIFCCDFDVKDINSSIGEIDVTKTKLIEYPYLIFEYALPRLLQYPAINIAEGIIHNTLEAYIRMPIMVVNSEAFPNFLATIETHFPV